MFKFLGLIIGWFVLLLLCWPLALVVAILLPVLWVISIPIRLMVYVVHAALALVKTLLFLPARILGYRSQGG